MERQDQQNLKYKDKLNEELFEEYQKTGSLELKQELALRYLYIVKSIAIQMRDVYVSFTQLEDVVHEGVIVLMKALDKYDPGKNVKFETYVSKRIRGMIIDIARKQDWIPRTVRKNVRDIQDATSELLNKNGEMPSFEEVAAYLNMSMNKFHEAIGKTNLFSVLSLDMLLEESSEKKKTVQIPSLDDSEQPEAHFLETELKGILEDGIRSLKKNERLVISLYYVEELNMKKIAAVMEVSEPRISQIHANAVKKLRKYIENTMQIKNKEVQ